MPPCPATGRPRPTCPHSPMTNCGVPCGPHDSRRRGAGCGSGRVGPGRSVAAVRPARPLVRQDLGAGEGRGRKVNDHTKGSRGMGSRLTTVAPGLVLFALTAPATAADGDPPASPKVTAAMQPYLDQYKLAGVIGVIADRS